MYRVFLFTAYILFASSLSAQLVKPLKQHVNPPSLPATIDFCGEKVPLEHFDVRESLQREMNSICYWHSSMIYTIQLAGRHMEIIEGLLKQYDIPDDFKYLCVAESNLQNVISPAKAAGFWQFMPVTAKEFKLEITPEIDERNNLEKSTKAACQYLKAAYKRFGNWTTAAASYNVGMSHVTNQLSMQNENSYYNLHLNIETARYVYRAVAFKIIMENPEDYGFYVPKSQQLSPLEYKEVKVTGPTDWVSYAQRHNTNYKVLRIYNPWITSPKLSTNKTYTIKLPLSRTAN